jgi:hypothetical protein
VRFDVFSAVTMKITVILKGSDDDRLLSYLEPFTVWNMYIIPCLRKLFVSSGMQRRVF